jgi:hypothetical protein
MANFTQLLFQILDVTKQYSPEVNDQLEVQSLSDFHVDYIRRCMEYELLRQQVSSDRFLKERVAREVSSDQTANKDTTAAS